MSLRLPTCLHGAIVFLDSLPPSTDSDEREIVSVQIRYNENLYQCIPFDGGFATVHQKKVMVIKAKAEEPLPVEFNPFFELHDTVTITEGVTKAIKEGQKFLDDAEFVEMMCVNPKSHGAMIVVEFSIRKTRYGVVVKNESGDGWDVIYRRRIPWKAPVKKSYLEFTKNATKVTMWKPATEKVQKLSDGFMLLPSSDVAERAEAAYAQSTVTSSDIGSEGKCYPEQFLLQISIIALDWRRMETEVLYKNVLVRIYQPSKLHPGDIVFAGRPLVGGAGTYYHAGVVYSKSDDGEVFIGHFGPDKDPRKKYKTCIGCPKLTTFDEFMRQSNGKTAKGIYRVEYLRDGSTHDVERIRERIEKSVRGELLPTVKNAEPTEEEITKELRDIIRIVKLPDKTRKVPCYHLKNWNCEDWAFWIVRGEESSEGADLNVCLSARKKTGFILEKALSDESAESEKKELCDAGKKTGNQDEKASSAQGTQGTNIAANVGQVIDKSIPVASAAWGVAEDFAPAAAKVLGRNIARGCGKTFLALGSSAGRAMFGGAAVAVSATVEGVAYGVNRFTIAKNAEKGKITEAEKKLLIDVQNQDAKYAAAQVGVTSACIGIAFIPVVGLPMAGIYGFATAVTGQRIRNAKKRNAIKDAIWKSTIEDND